MLIGGFFVARGAGSDDTRSASTPTTAGPTSASGSETETQRQEASPREPAAPRVETVPIRGGQPVGDSPAS